MTHDLHTLIGAYVLDAISDDERREFEEHLDTCDACAAELGGLLATSARLGASSEVRPPEALHDAVMAEVARTRQLPPLERLSPEAAAPVPVPTDQTAGVVVPLARRRPRLLLAVAAALVVLAGSLGGALAVEHHHAATLQQQFEATAQVYAAQDARTTTVDGGGGTLTVVTSARLGRAVVIPRSMHAEPGRSLQLWVMHDGTFRSAGLMSDGDPVLATDLPSGAQLGITSEPEGGSKKPTTPPLVTVDVT
jgi:anti-sigma factor RsiW